MNNAKIISVDGKPVILRRMFSAMVNVQKGKADACRTLYEDNDGGLWCVWHGSFYRTKKVSSLRYAIDADTRVAAEEHPATKMRRR